MSHSECVVIITGRLGKDPELRYTPGGKSVVNFSVATDRSYYVGEELKKNTSWHRVVAWGKLAESCGQYLSKGQQVYIRGTLEYGSYEKDGVKIPTCNILAERILFLGGGTSRDSESTPKDFYADDAEF